MPEAYYEDKFYVRAFTEAGPRDYRFFGEFTYEKDVRDCMGTGTLRMPYDPKLWAFFEPGFTELEIYGGTYDSARLFYGRTRATQQDGEYITVDLQDCGWKLKQQYEGTYENMMASDVFKMLVREAGMIPRVYLLFDWEISKGDTIEYDPETGRFIVQKKEKDNEGKSSETELKPGQKSGKPSESIICGTFYPSCGFCRRKEGLKYKKYYACYINKCPFCGRPLSNNPKRVPDGELTCTHCDADFCGTCGREKLSRPRARLTQISGPLTSGTVSTKTTDAQTIKDQVEDMGTYEDELKKITENTQAFFYTTPYNECILTDIYNAYYGKLSPTPSNIFRIEPWMIKYPTFKLNNNQFGYANTVEVKYKNGVIKEQYEDLVMVYGEIKKVYNRPKDTKQEAIQFAKAQLAKLVRDFKLEVNATILWSGRLHPGCWVEMPNPLTNSKEIYFLGGINVNKPANEIMTADITLLFAPENPLVSDIPETKGPLDASKKKRTIESIRQEGAKIKYSGRCQDYQCVEKYREGDCYGMSDWLWHKLKEAGYTARVIQYASPYSRSGTHRSVQIYQNGKWVDFDYTGFDWRFKAMSNKSGMFVLRGREG